MIVNLLGPYPIIHPFADQDLFTVLTYDSRQNGSLGLFDGLVYEEQSFSGNRHALQDDFCIISEGVLRTTIPLTTSSPHVYKCAHVWRDPTNQKGRDEPGSKKRLTTIKMQEGMLVVQDDTTTIVVDLALEIELKNTEKRTLWDHLTN